MSEYDLEAVDRLPFSTPEKSQRYQTDNYPGAVGLNWYLNSNLRCLFDWVYNYRDDVPVGTIPGWTSGFGMRAQLEF